MFYQKLARHRAADSTCALNACPVPGRRRLQSDHCWGRRSENPEIDFPDRDRWPVLTKQPCWPFVAQDERTLVAHGQTTMHTHSAVHTSKTSLRLIAVPQSLAIREAADSLILIWAATEAQEWTKESP
jgi:hypothetical protein